MTTELRPADTWLPLDVDELDYVAFDYTDHLGDGETVSTATVTCEQASTSAVADAGASGRLSGSPEIVAGAEVRQLVTGVLDGVLYLIRCVATTSSARRLLLAGTLPATRVGPVE